MRSISNNTINHICCMFAISILMISIYCFILQKQLTFSAPQSHYAESATSPVTQKNTQNTLFLKHSSLTLRHHSMDQDQLSGDDATAYQSKPPPIHDEMDFDDLDLDGIDCNQTANNDDLSDYGESFKAPSRSYRQSNNSAKPSRGGKRGKGRAVSENEDDQLSGQSFEGNNMDGTSFNGYEEEHKTDPPLTSRIVKKRQQNEDDLSDYGGGQDQDDEVSQYQNTLFGDLHSNVELKSSLASRKYSGDHNMDNLSEDVKQSERTNDMIAKRDPKREMNKFKAEKREKFNDSLTSSLDDAGKPMAISKKQKVENKKRFSKKQLELVSRKFSDYYAYETNKNYIGDKISLRMIGQMFELGHATVHKLYAEWMDDPYFYERIKRYDRYRKQTKNPQRKLTLDRLQHITRLIKENPFLTQYELCVELNKIEDLKVIKCGLRQNMTRTIVGKLLRMGKFRKKRVKCIPKEKNTSKSLEKRYEYCLKYKEILQRRAKVYFLDESGFNLYMTRDKAWSRPNEQITVNCPISKGKRFSLIAIIADDGLAHWRFIEGNYRKFEYLDFIRQLFQKINEHKSEQDPQEKWIVMDNCAIHDKEQTINLAREHGINVLYLPSYSPQLNPIENWFHEIKCKLKKINYSGEKQLFEIMERILKEYECHDFTNYYHGSLKFVMKGLKKEKF